MEADDDDFPNFPTREADIIALAEKIIEGMTDNPDFPSPPIPLSELRKTLDAFIAARKAEAASQAVLMQSTIAKENAINALFNAATSQLKETDKSSAGKILWN